jgi:peptidoglycan hydrolase-like protein with peptidoglycan-binding domain
MNAMIAPQNPNPFPSQLPARASQNALAEAGQQREIAEVQAAMVIAKRFPRDPLMAMDKILNACTRPTLAEGALYSYSRGGSDITGPSIRLAEAMAQSWGNISFGVRELEQRNGESTVEAFAVDIETNTRQVKVFQVPHERHTKSGVKKLTDPRDIYELVANQGARRLRACILGVIPGDVTEAAVKACESTLTANADTSTDGLKKLLAAFEPMGVTKEHIEKRIQSRIEAIRPAQVVQMKKVYASLRDGMSSPGDWFEMDLANQALTDKIAGATASA